MPDETLSQEARRREYRQKLIDWEGSDQIGRKLRLLNAVPLPFVYVLPGKRQTVSGAAMRTVLRCLQDSARESNFCWPSIGTIASHTGLSRATVMRALAALAELQLIAIERRWRRGHQETSEYVVLWGNINDRAGGKQESRSAQQESRSAQQESRSAPPMKRHSNRASQPHGMGGDGVSNSVGKDTLHVEPLELESIADIASIFERYFAVGRYPIDRCENDQRLFHCLCVCLLREYRSKKIRNPGAVLRALMEQSTRDNPKWKFRHTDADEDEARRQKSSRPGREIPHPDVVAANQSDPEPIGAIVDDAHRAREPP